MRSIIGTFVKPVKCLGLRNDNVEGNKVMIRQYILAYFPPAVIEALQRMRRRLHFARDSKRSSEEVFTNIYLRRAWGGDETYESGPGTVDARVVTPYLEAVERELRNLGLVGKEFVDLGCGDFRIGRNIADLASVYTGVDVVRDMIEHHREKFGRPEIQFEHLDIVSEPLPDGDVAFVRQVFQHMSNAEISSVLTKLRKYSTVFVTEHIPSQAAVRQENVDIVHGRDIRLFDGSGVFIDSHPFNVNSDEVRVVCETKGTAITKGRDPGVIRTWLWTPASH